MSEDLKEVSERAMRITGKEPCRNGNSQFKDPEAGNSQFKDLHSRSVYGEQ